MDYDQTALVHLAFMAPAPLLGGYLLMARKGTFLHRRLGKVYLAVMLVGALVSLFMPAKVGPQLIAHFGWIHALSVWTLISAVAAVIAVKRGDIATHKRFMLGLYIGMMVAFAFTFSEGRLLGQLIN